MQDFIKQNNLQIPAQSQRPKWLNNDRFWNLMFALGMTLGTSIALLLPIPFASGVLWFTIIAVPVLIKYCNGTKYEDGKFFTFSGRELNLQQDVPSGFFVIITTAAITALLGATLDNSHVKIPEFLSTFLMCSTVFFIPVLFFIYKNCPISIFFNRHVWRSKPMPYSIMRDSSRRSSEESSKRRYSIARSHYPGNMHYRPTYRR